MILLFPQQIWTKSQQSILTVKRLVVEQWIQFCFSDILHNKFKAFQKEDIL